ncbi:ROK family protein [Microbacterium thalassium]|uniref:Putative NBD/HSP70 family sugar kinase n=1 Tax=Microbacterium thalassium TaxID=362649 RepID=A0A7X0KUK1_9MICO|nr:ROK family protein [Microbacterium thalassium]MBB6391203.1 putative NBD/HSP70 family sugar kinase [Microbacterium thalassium]GLK23687.1 NagC family transcriptional regulator [Microbacterium thalassium]
MRVGLDVGGTKTDAVAVAPSGDIVARLRRPTGWGPDAVARTITDVVAALAAEPGMESERISSVGVGIPGQVEPGTTRVVHAVNLGVDDLDLAAAVGPRLGVPVQVENDVKAAALGADAIHRAAGREVASMAYLNLGTGVAAGIVADGVLWRGSRGAAGEVGHIPVDLHGPVCRCGQRGCVEALAGGGAIAARWREAPYPVLDVFDAADAGDQRARELRAGLASGVAAAIRVLVLTADVDTVVLGGGLTALGDRLLDDIRAELRTAAAASAFMRSLHLDERVEVLPVGSPAAALGAAIVGATRDPEEVLAHG